MAEACYCCEGAGELEADRYINKHEHNSDNNRPDRSFKKSAADCCGNRVNLALNFVVVDAEFGIKSLKKRCLLLVCELGSAGTDDSHVCVSGRFCRRRNVFFSELFFDYVVNFVAVIICDFLADIELDFSTAGKVDIDIKLLNCKGDNAGKNEHCGNRDEYLFVFDDIKILHY